jgi:alpha-amylase/alpha-mannosidase (GH57 family)
MRRLAIILGALFILPGMLGIATAATPDDITIDGDLSDWDSDTLIDIDSNSSISFRMTWNESHLFFAWEGTDWAATSEGADLFVYLNTTDGGSPLSKEWDLVQTLPFSADFAFVLEDSSYFSLQTHDGSGWVAADQTGVSAHVGWSGNQNTEISIPWANIGSPTSFAVLAWSQWQDEGNVWTSFPSENPASNSGAETFTHAYVIADRTVAQTPGYTPVVDFSGTVNKVDDALNLAIIFHQHQPYYKNQLTGMYEMPWVRVHGMTEYVDSPGILAATDTKVTYNLVPSLMEQMLDYTDNSTLDVHTDIARRAWNTGGYPNATLLELHTMQFQSFWNSGWIYNVSVDDPRVGWLFESSQRYSEIYGMTRHNLKPATVMDDTLLEAQDFLDLQVLWYLYQFSPAYVQGDYNASHRDEGLISLFQQNGQFTVADLTYVLDVQSAAMANILPMYAELAAEGQVELTTTPYYHPIMPLLMMAGWTFEDGIRVNKESWPSDVGNHLSTGMDLFESQMGFRPVGMWPSEGAVSPAMVQPVADVGIEWMVTDEKILSKSRDVNGNFIDTDDARNLAMPWQVGDVSVVFRDRVISDRVAWQYGSMTPEAAVSDFIAYVDDVRQQILDAGDDPSDHLLTVSMDGENWMFMSEFQHHDNGRPFTEEWFGRLATHPTIVTTTPGEFLAANRTLPEITEIGTGSWVDGTLSTWAGEAEESLGWQRLIEARQALVSFEADNPSHSGLEDAWESLYIAEGSDWYWWYGLDQDSGYDELWDTLFKVHLSNIYRAVNLDLPPYLQDLWTSPALPSIPYGGVVEPMIDGIALPGEWDGAAKYDADSIDGGLLDIESFQLGYDASSIYVRIDLAEIPEDNGETDVSIYFMQPNAVNFNEVETNYRTYYGNTIIGFPAKYMVAFNFNQLREDGQAKYDLFAAQGKVGGQERWNLVSQSNLGDTAMVDVFEFKIPWSELGLAPRYSTRVKVVTSWVDGEDAEIAPPAPAEMIMPDLEDWVTLLDIDDAVGDERGIYPTAGDFAPGQGLFDITHLKISQSAWNARFELTFAEMTDYWGLSNGFSHQIVQIYVDQGATMWGETDMLEGASAVIHSDWAWEVAISATGEPGAVKSVDAQTGETSAKGIEVSGSTETKTVTITVSKNVIGNDVSNYRFVIVAGSQDGFGPGKWREFNTHPATWRLGGGADPNTVDGRDYDPNIVDMVLEDDTQAGMLSNYDVDAQEFAVLTGIELPEIAQQIFGAKVVATTATTAILEWSTTREGAANVTCGQLVEEVPAGGLTQTIQISGLASNSSVECVISVDEADSVTLSFTTSAEIDETPPEILNAQAVVLEDNTVVVTWYTSEFATELLSLDCGEDVLGDEVALRRNHELQFAVTGPDICTITISVADAAGNGNSTTLAELEIPALEGAEEPEPGPEPTTPAEEDENAGIGSLISDPLVQIALLIVVLGVLLAFIRTRKHELDFSVEDDPQNEM